jgi:site-specific recombinase XerD
LVDAIERALGGEAKCSDLLQMITAARGAINGLMAEVAGPKLTVPEDVHPHLLRHGCGYKLVNEGVGTRAIAASLGHRNLQNTERYTAMSATRFNGLWQD